jgi:hypothetical protein
MSGWLIVLFVYFPNGLRKSEELDATHVSTAQLSHLFNP